MTPDRTSQRLTELSYFHLSLFEYLKEAHLDKAGDLSFITGRGDMAAESYSRAIKSGLNHIQAGEITFKNTLK